VKVSITVPGVDIDVERENVLVPANHEVFIKVFPEVTLADDEIRTIPVVSVKNHFLTERQTALQYIFRCILVKTRDLRLAMSSKLPKPLLIGSPKFSSQRKTAR